VFETLLGRIAAALKKTGIGYMVIGGQAVLLYGEPRLTKDIITGWQKSSSAAWLFAIQGLSF